MRRRLLALLMNVADMILTDPAVLQRTNHLSPFKPIKTAQSVTADEVAAKAMASYDWLCSDAF
jgi:3-oxoacid CoA-transferase subunit B